MNIKIGSNIAKYRNNMGVSQTELAEYLGVSPQAVSKWENDISVPDIYLIPKIACFFNVSIDTLFGVSDLDAVKLMVSKYSVQHSEKNYKDAKESIHKILDHMPDNLEALEQLCKLEYHRAMEFFNNSRGVCEKIKALSENKDKNMQRKATIQMIRFNAMMGDDETECYRQKFEEQKTVDNFNYLLIVLGENNRYQEIIHLGNAYINSFSIYEQRQIYPNLMEAAYQLGDIEYAKKSYQAIVADTENNSQIFNALWLLWKTYEKTGDRENSERCKDELLRQLPLQKCNEYVEEKIKNHIEGYGDKPENVM